MTKQLGIISINKSRPSFKKDIVSNELSAISPSNRLWIQQNILNTKNLIENESLWAGISDNSENEFKFYLNGIYANTQLFIRCIEYRKKIRWEIFLLRCLDKYKSNEIKNTNSEKPEEQIQTKKYQWEETFRGFLLPFSHNSRFERTLNSLAGTEATQKTKKLRERIKGKTPFG